MNLYIFNELSEAAVYGIGTYIRELTEAIRNSSINVCIVNLKSDKLQIITDEIDGIRHWFFPKQIQERRGLDKQKQNRLYYLSVTYLLQLYIEDKKNLIFHLNYLDCKPLVDYLKNAFDCKIILTVHYLESCVILLGNIRRLCKIISQTNELTKAEDRMAKISIQKEKEMFQAADKIICLANHTFDLLSQKYQIDESKISVINNGLTDSKQTTDKQILRQKYNIPDIPIIFFVGRLNQIKGLKYALQAYKQLLNSQTHCHFIIVGNGAFDEFMKECENIWMHVTWTGLIGKDNLYDLYSIADIGVIPSLYEPFGYVAVEMMMHGLPIVATATSGLNEIVDESCGLKIPIIEHFDGTEIDIGLLAEKILYLLQHPAEAKQMGQNGRKRYLKEYTSEIFRRNMLQCYESLIQ